MQSLRADLAAENILGEPSVRSGLNLLDVKIRDGEFKLFLPYRLPRIMGNDVAGVVTDGL